MSIKTPNTKINLINNRIKYGTDGGINVLANTLFVNETTGKVGFNTTSPTSLLDISGSIKSSSITDYSNSPGNNTQLLTKVNGQNMWSYSGYNFNGSDMFPQQTVDISAIIINNPVNYNYLGGVLAPNGRIYCIPGNGNNVGIINPYNNTIDTTSISGLPSGFKYLGGVVSTNGKIYCIPLNATNVGIIDPLTNTIDTTTISMTTYPDLSAGSKFWGGVLGTNGKIYCVPRGVNYVGIIDPINNTFDSTSITFTSAQSGANILAYSTGALGSNENIYFCPFTATSIMRLRTSDNSLNFIDVSNYGGFGSGRWGGSVCGPDGNVYLIPSDNQFVVRIDVSNETVSSVFNAVVAANGWCRGATLGLDGRIYGIPSSTTGGASNKLLFYDVLNNTGGTITSNLPSGGEKFYGGVLAPNGKIYMIPATYPNVATIETGIPQLQPWMMAPEFNKL
jgi:streptogramin lyase